MKEFNIDTVINGTRSAIAYTQFDRAQAKLTDNGFKIISLSENAELIIKKGKDSDISRRHNLVREGAIFIPNEISKLVRNPPILEYAKDATIAHSEGKEFYLNNDQIESTLEDSVDLPKKSTFIPTNRFSEEEITVWAFGYTQGPINSYNDPKKAQNYGNFLYELGTKSMPIWIIQKEIVDQENRPFARPLYFKGIIAGKSALIANDQDLHFRIRVRGIRDLNKKKELIRPLVL